MQTTAYGVGQRLFVQGTQSCIINAVTLCVKGAMLDIMMLRRYNVIKIMEVTYVHIIKTFYNLPRPSSSSGVKNKIFRNIKVNV